MASIFGNFILSTLENLEDKFREASYQEAERDYEWAAERARESHNEYNLHASRYNHWISEVERLENECTRLEKNIRNASDASRYRILYNQLRRAKHMAEEEYSDAKSAQRTYQMREEVAIKRAGRCGYPDSWF